MARLKKTVVIEKLQALGVDTSGITDYMTLCNMLQVAELDDTVEDTAEVVCAFCDEEQCTCGDIKHLDVDLVKRAREIGFVDEQIATYSDPVALKIACDNIKPQVTPQSNFRKRPKPSMRIKGVPAKFEFVSKLLETRAQHVTRVVYDESQMNDALRKQRIDLRSIQKVTISRNYIPDDFGELVSIMTIDYLKKD